MAEQVNAKEQEQALPRWLDELRPGGKGEGFVEKHLRHSLMFVKRPVRRLLVTFDNLSNVGDTSLLREPWAFKFAQDTNISHLGIMAHVSDWYRDPDLIERMQKLAADGFFDGYDRVVFAGVSMGGFASIAFGSLVPGAHAVAINPQSTLNEDLVPWESRYETGRRQDWTLPLSDAATLTEGFERVNIFYDPYHDLDQAHVDRFSGDNLHIFNCRYSNHKTAVFLRKIDALKPVMHQAVFGDLTELDFYRLYRARRNLPWFRGAVTAYYEGKGRPERAQHATMLFRQRLRRIQKQEAEDASAAQDWGEEAEVADTSAPDNADDPSTKPAAPAVRPQGSRRNDRRTIVTTMKNEGPFMLEWVAYHRAIGFTDFLIYTNHCDDGTDKIGMRLQELGVAQHATMLFRQRLRRIQKQEAEDASAAQDWGEEAEVADTSGPDNADAPAVEPAAPAVRPQGSRRNDRRTIVTTMKNEGPFMLEWVAYHRAIGFTDFLIYTNHCDDGTDKIGMRLQELGVAQHVDNRFKKGASPQRVALRRARREKIYDETDWIICSDCDEFLNVRAGNGTLDDLFEAVGYADAISLCWKIFGCGEQVAYEDRFVTEQFTWGAQEDFRGKYKALGLKTLFRPSDAIAKFGVHRPKFGGRPEGFVWTDGGGQPMPEKYFDAGWSAWPGFRHDHARLHHYAVRSVDSFLVKRDRGRTNHIDRDQGVAYWADLNLNMEEDPSLVPTAARTRKVFDELLSDPELARLHAEACEWHRNKIATLKSHKEWSDLHAILQTINRPGEMPVDRDQLIEGLAAE